VADDEQDAMRLSCARKQRYRSPEHAGKVAGNRGVKLRAYHCGFCDGWHLTSRDLKDFAERWPAK
jgi:hypothetical protein